MYKRRLKSSNDLKIIRYTFGIVCVKSERVHNAAHALRWSVFGSQSTRASKVLVAQRVKFSIVTFTMLLVSNVQVCYKWQRSMRQQLVNRAHLKTRYRLSPLKY